MNALMYQSNNHRRFAAALGAAVIIHVAAIGFATTRQEAPPVAAGFTGDPPEIFVEPENPNLDPQPDVFEPLPTPPPNDEFYVEDRTTPHPSGNSRRSSDRSYSDRLIARRLP